MRIEQEADCVAYIRARLDWLRRLAYLMCHDWDRADDIAQATITRVYANWRRVQAADSADAYTRTILVRVFLADRRSAWSRVQLGAVPEQAQHPPDDAVGLDVRAAVRALPPRQRATLVLRFFCDLSVADTAAALGCTEGTVKSQSAKAFTAMRTMLSDPAPAGPHTNSSQPATNEGASRG